MVVRCWVIVLLLPLANVAWGQQLPCDVVTPATCIQSHLAQLYNNISALNSTETVSQEMINICRNSFKGFYSCLPKTSNSECVSSFAIISAIATATYMRICNFDINLLGFPALTNCHVQQSTTACYDQFFTSVIQNPNTDICWYALEYASCVNDCYKTSGDSLNKYLDVSLEKIQRVCSQNHSINATLYLSPPTSRTLQTLPITDDCKPSSILKCYQGLTFRALTLFESISRLKRISISDLQLIDYINSTYLFGNGPCSISQIRACPPSEPKLHFDIVSGGLKYLFSIHDIRRLYSLFLCIWRPQFLSSLQQCGQTVIAGDRTDICGLVSNFSECVVNSVATRCSATAKSLFSGLVDSILEPVYELFKCHTTQTTTTPTTTPDPNYCGGCISEFNTALESLTSVSLDFSQLTRVCPKFFEFQDCVVPLYRNCEPSDLESHTTYLNAFTYICYIGYRDILKYAKCWQMPSVMSQFKTCLIESASLFRDICKAVTNIEKCMVNYVDSVCEPGAADVLRTYYDRILLTACKNHEETPNVTNHTTTADTTTSETTSTTSETTTTPSTSSTTGTGRIKCYSCNSGYYPTYQNDQCPINGHLKTYYVATVECRGPCVSKTNKWNKGDIFRDCSDIYWNPTPFPTSGCHRIRGETYCFCNSTLCNTQSLASLVVRN